MYYGVKEVQPQPNLKLLLTFENGEKRLFDIHPYLDTGVFRDLQDPSIFNTVRICFDTVEWPNGADLCPETLYRESIPVKVVSTARS